MKRENNFVKLKEYIIQLRYNDDELRPLKPEMESVPGVLDQTGKALMKRNRYVNFLDLDCAIEGTVSGSGGYYNSVTNRWEDVQPVFETCYLLYFLDNSKFPLCVTKDSLEAAMETTNTLE